MRTAAPVVSFADLIFHHALTRPQKPAIILADRVATYEMMAQGILRVTDRIRAWDLEPGALVCLTINSPIRLMIVAAALFRLGHPLVCATRPEDIVALQLPASTFLHGPGISLIPGRRHVVVDDDWFAGERRSLAASPPQGFGDDRDICYLALSSGTTGRPKAIALTIDAFQQRLLHYYVSVGLGVWDRMALLVGLMSSWGFTLSAHALHAGRTLVFAANPRESLHMAGLYAADAIAASSIQLQDIVREQTREPVPVGSLRTIFTGGGLLSHRLIAEARAKICSHIIAQYGSSEAGATAFASVDQLGGIEGACGFVAPWAEVEIVDETERAVPADHDGVVRIRATCQGAPYPPSADNPNFRGGWFYPGDLGRLTASGLLVLSGRTSEVINVGGLKLAPEVIEEALHAHPAVVEAAAFGTMGDSGIEEISVAVVANRPVADSQLIDWCAERGVPLTRIFMVADLPRTPSGKVHRDLLKRRLLESGPA
jgi:acyl-coenzyme A synthetase/AMP-(fatty) acid ligase